MKTLAVLIILTNVLIVSTQDPVYYTTPGYPNPFSGQLDKYRFEYDVPDGFGTAILFREFLMSAGDCVVSCSTGTTNCTSLCGDVMDHPKVKKILRMDSSVTITCSSVATSDMLYHSGISAKIVAVDLANPTYFTCGSTVDLSLSSTFYLVSSNYPGPPTDFSTCTVKFTSKDGIRFALYDFVSNSAKDTFVISGDTYEDGPTNQTFSGRHVTDDEPFGVYFKKQASVTFKFDSTSYPNRGFYILVDQFTYSANSLHSCDNSINTTLAYNTKYPIGTSAYGSAPYQPYTDCPMSFTTARKNTYILMDLAYESEKCCDTMDIIGLSPWPYDEGTFQGSQGRFYYFAANTTLSMHFQSDSVVQGPGFNGAIMEIDCTCNDTVINLSSALTKVTVTSPNLLKGSPTYCPNMNCLWKVNYPADYDLHMEFPVMNLRIPGTMFDSVTINDTFNMNLKSCTGSNGVPFSLNQPSGFVTISFTSSSIRSFPPSQIGRGFQIDMTLLKKTIFSTSINFNDTYIMEDISTRNFVSNINGTYEFIVKARPGKKLTIYFFTTLAQNAVVDIYDGPDTNSPKIDNTVLYSNLVEHGYAMTQTSSGSSLLIRVRANTDYGNAGQDFQAMVTDYDEKAACGPLVYTLRKNAKLDQITVNNGCLKVLHATDSGYDRLLSMKLQFLSTNTISVYKGLYEIDSHKLSDSSLPLPAEIFDRYVLLQNDGVICNLTYTWVVSGFAEPLTVSADQVGSIISSDYLPYLEPVAVEQQYTIELLGSGTALTGISIEFLKPIGQGYGTFQMEKYNDILWKRDYANLSSNYVLEECGTKLLISYKAPAGYNNGMFIKYRRGSLDCTKSGTMYISIIIALIFPFLRMF